MKVKLKVESASSFVSIEFSSLVLNVLEEEWHGADWTVRSGWS